MIEACKTFLSGRFKEILLSDGITPAYTDDNIFFGDMTRDFLKDNDYAVNVLMLTDRKKKSGRIIMSKRNEEKTYNEKRRRRFDREIVFRCLLYAGTFAEMWGESGFTGFIDQFESGVAQHRGIADSGNNFIKIGLQEAARPWNTEEETSKLKRRPYKGISRLQFTGGIHQDYAVPIIPSFSITHTISYEEA